MQRLRIIDLEHGDQPMFSEDASVAVILNGEIYNYRELTARLRAKGHRFRTASDTEVLVHLYEEEGPALVKSIDGMFAFAIWDEHRRQLLLGRDRLGKKPLCYSISAAGLTFASEIDALLQDPDIPRDVDREALDIYLTHHYVPAPRTALRTVRKLPPASVLVYRDGTAHIEEYWRLNYSEKLEVTNQRDVGELVRADLRRAVRARMIADVPLGAFLSGGVDSSAVVAAMAEHSPEPVKTFSIGFENEAFNELSHARRVAKIFGTDHQEFTVRPNAVEIIPEIVRRYGEPFADPSAIPSFYLARMASRHVKVALNGDGGDEAFGGYARYATNASLSRLSNLPRSWRQLAATIAERVPPGINRSSLRARLRRMAIAAPLEPAARYGLYVSGFRELQRAWLYSEEHLAATQLADHAEVIGGPWSEASGDDAVDVMLEVDTRTYLPGDLLVKMDIATMASGLEARSPLLDHKLMELAASLPAEWKVRGRQKKRAFRLAMRGWLPDEILDRPKAGFEVPIADWFRGELRGYARDILLDRATTSRGYFRTRSVETMLDRHARGAEDHADTIWALLMHEQWHRQFVDAPRPARPPRSLAGVT